MYNINDCINNTLVVTNIKIIKKNNRKIPYYQYRCLKCGYDCGGYYYKGVFYEENWVSAINGCACCSGKYCVTGLNDIATTDKYLINYFYNTDDGYKYRSGSEAKIMMICPFCNEKKLYKIADLKNKRYLPCVCNDNISIPNKFAYYVFQQLKEQNQIHDYCREYQPVWGKPYFYDNYFTINHTQYIVELDGELGHGLKIYGDNKNSKDTQGLQRDIIKDALAKENNVILIRIHTPYKNNNYLDFLKEQVYSNLSNLVNLNTINWNLVYSNVYKNTIKEVCTYYEQNHCLFSQETNLLNHMSNKFILQRQTIVKYLKIGKKYGWCSYMTRSEIKKNKYLEVITLYNKGVTLVNDIAQQLDLPEYTVKRLLNEGTKENLCYYSGKEVLKKTHQKPVYVLASNGELLKYYSSNNQCSESSLTDFGVYFSKNKISQFCTGNYPAKTYKGYIFTHELQGEHIYGI